MTFAKAQEEFCVRYYWWAREDIRREVHCAYPFLQTFRTGTERRFLNMVEDFSESQVIEMLTALLKRRMKKALEILGEQFSLADDDLCKEYFRRTEHPTQQEMRDLDDGHPDKRQLATFKRNLAASLRSALEPSLGGRPYQYNTLTWRYDQEIEGWPVHTWFDLGGRSAQLTYSHSVGTLGSHMLHENVNLCSWLGLSSETSWSDVWRLDSASLSQTLVCVSKHFLEIAPKMLAGLKLE